MKIIVLVKIIKGELNIFDQSALEAALRIQDSEVTVISMAPDSAKYKLRYLTRLGVQRVIHACDKVFAGSDTLATAYILSCIIKKLEYDYIFCGRQSTDGDTAQVGPCLSSMLGINPVTNVMEANIGYDGAICKTRLGDETCGVPALLTFERIFDLRFPSIFSKESEIETMDNSEIGADPKRCGTSGSPTKVIKVFEKNEAERQCKQISFEELLPLIEKLKKRNPVISQSIHDSKKLKEVWAIGKKVQEKAREIADKVVLIDEENPHKVIELARTRKPEFILWNADLKGRKNAPIVAATLNTGLCADCTMLETDGKDLYMYRPACEGNVTVKIICSTKPVMATVRTVSQSNDIVVAVGRGAKGRIEEIKAFANLIGAEFCSSRALVDENEMPYSSQVGLTGKNVAPKIYIAIGISGAIHHRVGMENAEYVICINHDETAPFFKYSDFFIKEDIKQCF